MSLSHVASILVEKYLKFWTSERKLYSGSDSSVVSGKGGRVIIEKEVDDTRRAVLGRGKARDRWSEGLWDSIGLICWCVISLSY